jgi:hypothetical protein
MGRRDVQTVTAQLPAAFQALQRGASTLVAADALASGVPAAGAAQVHQEPTLNQAPDRE